jgi:hypothetical protein
MANRLRLRRNLLQASQRDRLAVSDEQVINPVTLELLHNTGCATISADLHIVLVNAFIPTLEFGNRFAVVSIGYLLSGI